jgi:PAS domain S-box-containing protein
MPVTRPAASPLERPAPVSAAAALSCAFDAVDQSVAVLDDAGVIVAVNEAWRRFAAANGGAAERCGVGCDYLAACDVPGDRHAEAAAAGLRALLEGRSDGFGLEYPCHAPGEQRWFVMEARPFAFGEKTYAVVQHHDETCRHRLHETARLRAGLLDAVPTAVIASDGDYRITEWNQAAERMYGWSRDEALDRDTRDLLLPVEDAEGSDARYIIEADGSWAGDMTLRRRDGSVFPAHVRSRTIHGTDGDVVARVGVSMDVTESQRAQRELASAKHYLAAITDHIGEGLMTLDEHGQLVYLNEAAEHMLGWKLADVQGEVFHYLMHARREDGTPFPLEECPMLHARRDDRVVRVAQDTFIRADGSTMVASYTAAPFETPDGRRGSVVVFADASERAAERAAHEAEVERLTWVTRIQDALRQERFELLAQPIVDVTSGHVAQHELLIRMQDEDGSLILPGEFLPAAEEHGVIGEIDRWVAAQAVALAAAGRRVEFNISAASVADAGMADFIGRELAVRGARPSRLTVELTETALMSDPEAGRALLARLADLGVKIALDDFGTGYGGFTYLKQLPVDYLKIDREFVRDLPRSEMSRNVVEAVVQLARKAGKLTIAEGVEDDETLELLRAYGVDLAQGFLLGRPAPL